MPTVALDDFIAQIAERTKSEGTRWLIAAVGRIRTADGLCPLAYWTGEKNYDIAAIERGLRSADMAAVMEAADWMNASTIPLRRRLLEATGLARW